MRDNKVKKTVKNCEKVFAVNGRNLKEAENEYTTGGSRGKAAAMGRDSSPAFRRFQWPRSIQEVKRIDQEQFKALKEMEAPSTRYASTAIADPQTGKTMLPIWDEVLTNFYRAMEWDEDIITVMS